MAKQPLKILIGTPINQIKDYCMQQWLVNVAALQKVYPTDLLLVDNSHGLDYVTQVEGYCQKIGVQNYQIKHIEVGQFQPVDEKINRSREVIRQQVLGQGYDAWFSWESDQIIPVETLAKLVEIMTAGNYSMVHPNAWSRQSPNQPQADFGVCLIGRWCLEKYGFLLEYPDRRECWHGGELWFKKQVLKAGGSYIEIYGSIQPIFHLNNPNR